MRRDTHTFRLLGKDIAQAARDKSNYHKTKFNSLSHDHVETRAKGNGSFWTHGKWVKKLEAMESAADRHLMLAEQLMVDAKAYDYHKETLFELDAEDLRYFGLVPYPEMPADAVAAKP